MANKRITLSENELPDYWYNIAADMPNPPKPSLHPKTGKPAGMFGYSRVFPSAIIEQEGSTARWIEIPEEVRETYKMWRPAPMRRAYRLEKLLDTPAHIYYKDESVSPTGSHKLNTAIPQAYYNRLEGTVRLTTETGAGQWGSSLGFACGLFGLKCTVYMVKVSMAQKPYRRVLMEMMNAEVIASPSNLTEFGREALRNNPDTPGTLAIAGSEASEDALGSDKTRYAVGSVLNFVCLHQTIIGLEAKIQMEKAGEYPDVVIGCCGGGSNFAGIAFPFLRDKLTGAGKARLVAVEPEACPTLTKGVYRHDYGDAARKSLLMPMYTLGVDYTPVGIHAGGLRFHGAAPLVSQLYDEGWIEARACRQSDIFNAAVTFARSEGFIPAPESAHAIHVAIEEAIRAKEAGEKRVILLSLSGHGHYDMSAYEEFLQGKLGVVNK